MFEYDAQASLTYAEEGTNTSSWQLNFPYSTVLFLEPHTRISDRLSCELRLPVYSADTRDTEIKSIDYAVPAIKVQSYTLQEIREKQLLLLIPFTPIRFRKRMASGTRKKQNYDPDFVKLELANFFHEIIMVLDEATLAETICEIDRKDILALFRKAMIRVFHEDPFLLEVINHMTAPVLELERETIARLQKENEALRTERGAEKSRMDAEMDALRSERDALKSQNIALMTEVEALRAPKGPFRSWRKRLKRNH
ncbi:MAG: hypothetical protein LIP12_08310 [Clostridiales bacterium]|nr:hypothetical protein [Clostridiales bacterium]